MNGSTSFFDRWSRSYDGLGLQALAYRPLHDAILARIDAGAAPTAIIDLGCGTGQLMQRLAGRFPTAIVIGVDVSSGMLARAARRVGSSGALVRADAQLLPVAASSVDLVVCSESFHWYRDQPEVLDGVAEVLRPDGKLLIASIATFTRSGERTLRRLSSGGTTIRAVPPRRLRRMLSAAGFEVRHQRRIPRLAPAAWPVLTEARRR